jgi:prepilin-type N-terminal cleavage/methylation domain-containing protein/prepilin-type processing-associated H-X9-DG protein
MPAFEGTEAMVRRKTNPFREQHAGLAGGLPRAYLPGFTLIELLVVIAMIALLMAILVPTLSRVRKQAKGLVCQTKLRQWGAALGIYMQDNEGRFPCNAGGSAGEWLLRGALLSVTNTDPNVAQNSFHHFQTRDIILCPMATRSRPLDGVSTSSSGSARTTFDIGPSVRKGTVGREFPAWVMFRPEPLFVGSYGVNSELFRIGGFGSPGTWTRRGWLGPDVLSLRGKPNIPVLLDSGAPSGRPFSAGIGPPFRTSLDAAMFMPFCVDRHDGYVNGLFLDWSVRKLGLKELWKLKWTHDFDTNGPWTKAGGVTPEKWPKWMRKFKDY